MGQFAILRFEKRKGAPARSLEAHHERLKKQYKSNPDIDTAKSADNIHLVTPDENYRKEIDKRIASAGCRVRKDSIKFIDTLVTASPDFFVGKSREEVTGFFLSALKFMQREVGADNIFSAVVHTDERTPHMHLCFVPLTQDSRLSAKEIIGNRVKLQKWQTDFFDYMAERYPELQRGKSAEVTHREHIPTWLFKQAQGLTERYTAIEKSLDGINLINAHKKREEVLEQLSPWFRDVQLFSAQIKQLQSQQDYAAQRTAELQKENSQAWKYIKEQNNALSDLELQLQQVEGFVNSIPDDLYEELQKRRQLEEQQWQQNHYEMEM